MSRGWDKRRILTRDGTPTSPSAHALVGSGVGELDVIVPPELLADLHDPRLVITLEYVGPERRQSIGGRRLRYDRPVRRRRSPWSMVAEKALMVLALLAAVGATALFSSHAPVQALPRKVSPLAPAQPARPHRPAHLGRDRPDRHVRRDRPLAATWAARVVVTAAAPLTASPGTPVSCGQPGAPAPTPRCARRLAAAVRRTRPAARRAVHLGRRTLTARSAESRGAPTRT